MDDSPQDVFHLACLIKLKGVCTFNLKGFPSR